MRTEYNIVKNFIESSEEYGDRLFYSDSDCDVTYSQMAAIVKQLAAYLLTADKPKKIGILGTKSADAYAGILAAGMVGAAYVPLNLKWPEQRIIVLLDALQLDALIIDKHGATLLTPALLMAAPDMVIIGGAELVNPVRHTQKIVDLKTISLPPLDEPVAVAQSDLAYILFTSGTTGLPKGVMISAGALKSYLDEARVWTQLTPEDKLAETCDISFDLTVHNLFLCAQAGASLNILSALEMLAPSRFIRSRGITVWMSVPTLAAMMRKSGALKPGTLPSLRSSIFCGEPLPASLAQAWAEAAPNGVIDNIYGPTEGTVICLRQRVSEPLRITPERNIIAIGTPYETMTVAVFDENQQPVADGEAGEIALCGPQLADGYFNYSLENQSDRFREINGKRWYLTGDLGSRDADGVFHHLGRTDNQIKLKGNRIELEEVEAHLRNAAATDMAAVVAWPVVEGSAQGLVAFCTSAVSDEAIAAAMYQSLPRYMVPETIHICDALPVNINGKIDRRQLTEKLNSK